MTSRSTWRRCVVEDHHCSNNLPKQLKKLDGPAQGVKRTVKRTHTSHPEHFCCQIPLLRHNRALTRFGVDDQQGTGSIEREETIVGRYINRIWNEKWDTRASRTQG